MGAVSLIKRDGLRWEKHPDFKHTYRAYLSTKGMTEAFVNLLLRVEPGGEIHPHTHEDRIDALYVLEGEGEALVNGRRELCEAGDYIFNPSQTEHGIKNTGNKPLILYATFSPP